MNIPLYAERLFNRPVALEAFKNEVLIRFVNERMAGVRSDRIDAVSLETRQLRAFADDARTFGETGNKPFRHDGNIAVIRVEGTLVHRSGYLDAESGLVGYNDIISKVRAAQNDSDIGGVFVPIKSGGGECEGLMAAASDLAKMAKSEGGKPIYFYLDEHAFSAAYILASAGDKIFGRRESQGGSISAIINIIDRSRALEKLGLEPIIIRPDWADRKARGGGLEKVDAETIAGLKSMVDEMSDMLVEFVAAMRGVSESDIKGLRGDVFTGTNMIRHNLIDDIVSEQEAWAMLKSEVG
jgi:capsid assembly protease